MRNGDGDVSRTVRCAHPAHLAVQRHLWLGSLGWPAFRERSLFHLVLELDRGLIGRRELKEGGVRFEVCVSSGRHSRGRASRGEGNQMLARYGWRWWARGVGCGIASARR